MTALCQFGLIPEGLRHANLRPAVASMLGMKPGDYSHGQMTYDLRRLRLHGLIERIPGTHRYRLTKLGTMASQFYTRLHKRVFRPAMSCNGDEAINLPDSRPLAKLDKALGELLQEVSLAA